MRQPSTVNICIVAAAADVALYSHAPREKINYCTRCKTLGYLHDSSTASESI